MKVDYLKSLLLNAGDEPDRIQQLRKLIVALAISGKLGVNQRSHDLPNVSPDALPAHFGVTAGFTVLSAVARIEKGRTGIKQAVPGAYPLVVTAAERSPCDHFDFEGPAAIVPLVSSTGHGKASLHRLHYQEGKFALGTILAAIFPLNGSLISARFIFEYLSAFKDELLVSRMIGTANVSLSVGKIAEVPVPLVSLDVQAKVDELMALCDQLEAARSEREATRDRLAAAGLARLNAPDPETLAADFRFALDAMSALTTRADQIKQLRQTILNLAVRGKLAPQDANEEPASELLKRIAIEKARLVKIGEIRKGQPLSPVSEDELPFDLPSGWAWARLGNLIHLVSGQHLQPPEYSEDPKVGLPYITGPSDFTAEGLQITRYAVVRKAVAKKGQLLLTVKGSGVGKTAICNIPEVAISRQLMALTAVEWNDRFLLLVAHRLAEKLQGEARSLIPGISREDVDEFVIPLPPLAEQHRIVSKVDELRAICDQLEGSLAIADDTRRRLLDALLHEALAPVAKPSKEHARAAVSGYLVSRLASKRNFGRTAHMKHLYFAESRLGLDLGGRYMREAAGPLDTGIYELEKRAEAAGWYTHSVETLPSGNEKVSYQPGKALKAIAEEGITVLGRSRAEMDRLIDLMGGMKTEPVEIIATLFAAWNDALLDGQSPDDNWIIKEVREHWHVSKQRFTPADLKKWLVWMRQNDVVPLGHAPRTMQQTTMEF